MPRTLPGSANRMTEADTQEQLKHDPGASREPGPNAILSLRDLPVDKCRWPIGDPRHDNFHYCGDAVVERNAPYCAEHTRWAYHDNNEVRIPGDVVPHPPIRAARPGRVTK